MWTGTAPHYTISARMRAQPAVVLALVTATVVLSAQNARRTVSLMVIGGTVLTQNDTRQVFSPGAVAINGSDIVDVGALSDITARFASAQTIDARDQVVLPGLINTHTHAPMVMFRGLADDLALMDWLQKYIFPAEAKTVSPEFVRTGTRLAALEMIQSGTTTYADMYYFEEEIAKATKEAGLRGVLGQTIIQFPVADAPTPAEGLARAEAFIKTFKDDPLIVPAVAPHAMYTLDQATLVASAQLGRKYGVPVIIHLAETQDEVKTARDDHKNTPAGYLESIGFWGPKTVAAHGVWVTDEDIAILKKHNVGVSHNPESNMKLASGTAPVLKYLAAGVNLSLGTDGAASNNDLDMFEAMRQASFLAKLSSHDPTAVPAQVALDLATAGGAKALGMESQIGSLEAGKRADLITVAMNSARQTPMYDAVSHLVYVTRGDDVRNTIVNGRVLMRDRRVNSLNEADVRQVPELFRVVEPVPDDEVVVDGEADVLDLHVHLATGRLAEEARRAQHPRIARTQNILEVGEGQTGVDNVLDDEDVLAVERGVEVFREPDFAGTRSAFRVARDRHEIHRDAAFHVPDQVRHEDEGALEDGDEVKVSRIVRANLRGHFGHAILELVGADQDAGGALVGHTRCMIPRRNA
jgi:5-methylthioadenosine/S-adenosylhomocysteine deaminase